MAENRIRIAVDSRNNSKRRFHPQGKDLHRSRRRFGNHTGLSRGWRPALEGQGFDARSQAREWTGDDEDSRVRRKSSQQIRRAESGLEQAKNRTQRSCSQIYSHRRDTVSCRCQIARSVLLNNCNNSSDKHNLLTNFLFSHITLLFGTEMKIEDLKQIH